MEKCDFCPKTFRFRFALREHVRKSHHKKDYQLEDHERFSCRFCNYATFSERAFTAHSFLAHSEENSLTYKCRVCCAEFQTQIQAIRHRKTKAHKRKVKMKSEFCERISCSYCADSFDEIKEHEDHMWKKHLKQTSQCGFCGLRFAFPQELSAHVRTQCSMEFSQTPATSILGKKVPSTIHCDERGEEQCVETNKKFCDFTCDNITMLYYHKMLKHSKYFKTVSPNSGNENQTDALNRKGGYLIRAQQRMTCIVCGKDISRGKLWQHLSTHGETNDVNNRKCKKCFKIYPTLPHLEAHQRRTNHSTSKKKRGLKVSNNIKSSDARCGSQNLKSLDHKESQNLFECAHTGCNYTTEKASHLNIHRLVHDRNSKNRILCAFCDSFSCKRKSELNRHLRSRHPNKYEKTNKTSIVTEKPDNPFRCASCDYSTSFKQHYNRHLLIHKPGNKLLYKCKFCHFTCATVENLRKHILKTNSHPGISIYTCSELHCSFSSNEANDYKNHLISQHRNSFTTLQEIRNYIKQYFLLQGAN